MYDVDDFQNLLKLEGHDFVGGLEFTLHEVVTARDQLLERPLVCPTRAVGLSGVIRITAEEKSLQSAEEL